MVLINQWLAWELFAELQITTALGKEITLSYQRHLTR